MFHKLFIVRHHTVCSIDVGKGDLTSANEILCSFLRVYGERAAAEAEAKGHARGRVVQSFAED
jgi:hypothetical protein